VSVKQPRSNFADARGLRCCRMRRLYFREREHYNCAGSWNVGVAASRACEERVPVNAAAAAEVDSPTRETLSGAWSGAPQTFLLGKQQATDADVDHLEDVHAAGHGGRDDGDEAKHCQAAVEHLGGGRQAALKRHEEAVRLLIRLTVEQRERVAKHLRAKGSGRADRERVHVHHHDDGALGRVLITLL